MGRTVPRRPPRIAGSRTKTISQIDKGGWTFSDATPGPDAPFQASSLAPFVLPHPRLPFRQPLDRGRQTLLARLLRLRFGHPLHIILLLRIAEPVERRFRVLVLLERSQEVRWNYQFFFLSLGPSRDRRTDPFFVEFLRLFEIADENLLRRQILHRRQPSKRTHRACRLLA